MVYCCFKMATVCRIENHLLMIYQLFINNLPILISYYTANYLPVTYQ